MSTYSFLAAAISPLFSAPRSALSSADVEPAALDALALMDNAFSAAPTSASISLAEAEASPMDPLAKAFPTLARALTCC